MKRTVLVVAHTGRPAAVRNARLVVDQLTAAGVNVRVLAPVAADLQGAGADVVPAEPAAAADARGLGVAGVVASPLPGPAGNVEYFLWLRRGAPPLREDELRRAVEEGPQ